jgi:hypothetical protein|tara:strand:+ start:286 stop:528 length:243 start_codon:yes stop_codon:yes gene_type:complete
MKEIEAIQMRKWIRELKTYGFTDLSISKYAGIQSNQTVREFAENQDRMLQENNHKALYEWLFATREKIIILKQEEGTNYG